VYKTRQDKPHLKDERERIEAAGGTVFIPPPPNLLFSSNQGLAQSSRVIIPISIMNEVALAMSRSIGDYDGKAVGVIADPIVDRLDVHELKVAAATTTADTTTQQDIDLFAVSASDRLFNVIQPLVVAKILAKSLYQEEEEGGVVHRCAVDSDILIGVILFHS